MNARFYAPEAHAAGQLVALPDDEAQHLTRVLRLGDGEAVRVFNGRGGEFDGRVERAGRGGVEVRLGDTRTPAQEARVAVTLVQAVLKSDRMDDVVRDAVMIGVAAVQPLLSGRTELSLDALQRSRRRDRWQRIAVSSAKQCGRAVVPAIREPVLFSDVPAAIRRMILPPPAVMLVEPGASVDTLALSDVDPTPPREVTLITGPEGGWTPEEIAAASGSCRLLTMGGRTLRADAMAIVAVAALFARWGEL